MKNRSYQALVVEEVEKNRFIRTIRNMSINDLPEGDLLIRVKYSSLNYKDALSASGNRGVTRQYPHTPGIDAAGVIEKSSNDQFKAGDEVIVTSYDLGMNTSGGFGQFIRVPAGWAVKLPEGLTLEQSMIFGTAGFTAGMSIYKLLKTITPEHGKIVVTGATGGVGSIAAGILCHLGFEVDAVSGKSDTSFLKNLGVKKIIDRNNFIKDMSKPLLKPQWAGAVDTVGGDILATAIKSVTQNGVVTCCGNVASADIPVTVYPFILRGISLHGIDSQNCPMDLRCKVWDKLALEWKIDILEEIFTQIHLNDLNDQIDNILKGKLKGRTVVNLD